MSRNRWTAGAGALAVSAVVGGVCLSGVGVSSAQAQTLSGLGVVPDTNSGRGALVRSGPTTHDTEVIGGIKEGTSAKALCYVVGETVAGHVRTTNRWALTEVGPGFSSASNLRGAEKLEPCPQITDARASRGRGRIFIPIAKKLIEQIKRERYEPEHQKSPVKTPRKHRDHEIPDSQDQTQSPESGVLGLEEMGELRSVNYTDFVIGAGKGDKQAHFIKGSSPYGKVLIVQGFSGENSVALKLSALGMYLRHENGRLVPSFYQDNDLWKQDASFYERSPLDDRGGASLSLESVNYRDRFIRHYEGKFEIGTPDTRPGTPFNADATFNWLR